VLILTGEGETFSAGADISEFADSYASPEEAVRTNATVRAGQAAVATLSKPVIARIRGACVGGGCGLALSADLRFAASDARLGITPARLGLAYSFADTKQLVDVVGPARAKDILFSARLIGAEEALTMGLVDRCLPPGALEAETRAYAESLAGLSQVSIRTAKAMIEAVRAGADTETDALRAAFEASFAGADFAEGYRAFLDKRRPEFG
jgi:enoyl-CoA hydratase/carnithine racemase